MTDALPQFNDHDILARTLWAEARSQGTEGMVAVCNVVQNRAKQPGWWGHDVRSVCLASEQFSCWDADDPQAKLMRSPRIMDVEFAAASTIADVALLGALTDLTHGADHYVAEYAKSRVTWDDTTAPTFICGRLGSRHFFYKLGLKG